LIDGSGFIVECLPFYSLFLVGEWRSGDNANAMAEGRMREERSKRRRRRSNQEGEQNHDDGDKIMRCATLRNVPWNSLSSPRNKRR
jgi:hypothetical protein